MSINDARCRAGNLLAAIQAINFKGFHCHPINSLPNILSQPQPSRPVHTARIYRPCSSSSKQSGPPQSGQALSIRSAAAIILPIAMPTPCSSASKSPGNGCRGEMASRMPAWSGIFITTASAAPARVSRSAHCAGVARLAPAQFSNRNVGSVFCSVFSNSAVIYFQSVTHCDPLLPFCDPSVLVWVTAVSAIMSITRKASKKLCDPCDPDFGYKPRGNLIHGV